MTAGVAGLRTMTVLFALLVMTGTAQAVTESECRRDAGDLRKEIERNRQHSNSQYQQVLAEVHTDKERAGIKEQMEQIWHDEEQLRGFADQMLRDCLRYLSILKQKPGSQ